MKRPGSAKREKGNRDPANRVPARQPEDQPVTPATPAAPRANTLPTLFGIDSRSLALFRIFMAVLLLIDLGVRLTDLRAMYTDDGMFPRADIIRLANVWNWSFHFASGAPGYQAMLFGLAGVLALSLLVGFETRLAAVGSWLMLLSVQHRVPPILSGAEILLRMLLFWSMFLPLGNAWSVDRWRKQRSRAEVDDSPILSVASAAILIQIGLMYLLSAIFKTNQDWLSGQAAAGSLAHDFYGSRIATHLLQFPHLLKALTWGTFALEWAAPFLLFSPKWTSRTRLAAIASLALMHFGIFVSLEVGMFSFVSISGLSLFLPAEFWNRFSRQANVDERARSNTVATYLCDGVCGVLLLYVLAANLNTLGSHPLAPLRPEKWRPFATGLGLGQKWGMFDTIPSKNGWYVANARLKNGSEVDLLRNGAPLEWRRPDFPAGAYPNYFWQKLFREMAYDDEQGYQFFRGPVSKYLCREWNSRNRADKQIAQFDLIYCTLGTAGPADACTPVKREQLFHLDLSDAWDHLPAGAR